MPHPEWHPADINPPWEDEETENECLYCGTHCHCDTDYDRWKERDL